MMQDDPLKEKRKKFAKNLHGAYVIGVVVISAVVVLAGYRSFRRIFAGFSRDFMSPFFSCAVKAEDRVEAAGLMFHSKRELARQLAAATRERARLATENALLNEVAEENGRLRALLSLPGRTGYEPVFAEVLTRSVATWRERFVINRGEEDGIAPGDLVVAPDRTGRPVVAGRIKEVSKHTATVITLYSDECHLSVMLTTSRLCGALELGVYSRRPIIQYLPADGTYAEGETVATSGISSHTPHGILIGSVVRNAAGHVATIRDQMFAEVEVKPFLEMDSVQFLAVYIRKVPQ